MEQEKGKNCPFCKTDIQEGEVVKICPSCGMHHHESCWEENKGCATFGCTEQYVENPVVTPDNVVSTPNVPASVPIDSTEVNVSQGNICGKCGAEMLDGQKFCVKCGQKADLAIDTDVSSAISQFNANIEKNNQSTKKKPLIIIFAAIILVVVIAIGTLVIPKLLVSVEDLCAKGDYAKAYEKARGNKKEDVIIENNIAVCSDLTVASLKDSKSFDLREAWYDPQEGRVVLKVAANNSYGNTVINYWLFVYDHEKDKKWELFDSYSDLSKEEFSYYDDEDEKIEKIVDNLGKGYIQNTMVSANAVGKASVKRINNLFKRDLLDTVDHIDAAIPKEK